MPLIKLLPSLHIQTDNLDSISICHTSNKIYVYYKLSSRVKEFDCTRHGGVDIVESLLIKNVFACENEEILYNTGNINKSFLDKFKKPKFTLSNSDL